jgi:hypothetical protein
MLSNAFNVLIRLHSRAATIERPGAAGVPGTPQNIRITPSNYFRNLAAVEETIIEGREFVVTKKSLDDVSYGTIQRGDILNDTDFGRLSISEVREVFDLGGAIMGYRIRTS